MSSNMNLETGPNYPNILDDALNPKSDVVTGDKLNKKENIIWKTEDQNFNFSAEICLFCYFRFKANI